MLDKSKVFYWGVFLDQKYFVIVRFNLSHLLSLLTLTLVNCSSYLFVKFAGFLTNSYEASWENLSIG